MKYGTSIAAILLTLTATLKAEKENLKYLSFENNAVPSFVTALKGKLSISGRYAQEGTHSLRWDWLPGDKLTFKIHSLGDINKETGYGGYLKSAFVISLYNPLPQKQKMLFTWLSKNNVGATFAFPLIMRGWQNIVYHYSFKSKLKNRNVNLLKKTDEITITAPVKCKGGTLYIDMLNFNTPVDFRRGRTPVSKIWQPFDIAKYKDKSILSPPTKEELASIKKLCDLIAPPGNLTVTENMVDDLKKEITKKYNLKRCEDGSVKGNLTCESAEVSKDLLKIAKLWNSAKKSEIRRKLEDCYFLLDDYFRDSGAVAQGRIDDLRWYHGRDHGDATFIMRDPLRRTKRMQRVLNCLKYNWNYGRIFNIPKKRKPMGVDYFYIDTRYLLNIALMHRSPELIVRHLRAFAKRFNIDVINEVEPDGSIYHHGAYNFPYVSYGLPAIALQLERLSKTPFAVSKKAFVKVKKAAMAMRWFCNLKDAPLSMHGRHPGRMTLHPKQYLYLADAGRIYNNGKMDRELASAYLRFVPKDADKKEFLKENIKPESPPNGNRALNFAALEGHRRDEWLAVVRGYGKHSWACESYANANRYGLFMGNGYLDILASGNPINIIDSGCDIAHGWDWRYYDGTTTFAAPLAKIANGNGTLSERGDVTFVGGLSDGENGIFVFPLNSHLQYVKALPQGIKAKSKKFFAADKTYFFFDNVIVCLGSGISLPDSKFPVVTTLFQKHLKTPDVPIFIDGKKITELPFEEKLQPDKPHTLLDIQNTGYYIPSTYFDQKITVMRRSQKSRDGDDKRDTVGDYAIALINHGVTPENAKYEYFVIPKSSPEKIAKFAEEMRCGIRKRPFLIWQLNNNAHIVYDKKGCRWGYVFFKATKLPPPSKEPWYSFLFFSEKKVYPLLRSVSQSVLVMTEKKEDGVLKVTVCDPDYHLGKKYTYTPSEIKITVAGEWLLKTKQNNVSTKALEEQTYLNITCREGRSITFELERK